MKGITIQIGGDTTKLGNALKGVNSAIKKTQSELKGVNTLLKFDPANVTLITQKQKLLSSAIVDTKDKLDALRQTQRLIDSGEIEATEEQYRDLQREIASTESRLKKLSAEYKEFASASAVQLQVVGKQFQQIGDKMTAAGEALLPLTAAIGTVGLAGSVAAIQFESSFAGVKKTVDATTEELEELAIASREAALETPVDVNSINYIKELGGQLGIATGNLNSFAEVIAALDVSTDMNLDEASLQLAQFMNICGTAQTDIDRLGSTIVALGNTSATTESTIAEFAMRIAGAGQSIGLTEAEILGLSASLASVGIQAEMGGSAISTIMSQIDKDVAHNGESLQAWAETAGMSAQEFAAAWEQDAASALIALIGGMEEASLSGENLNLILDELGVENIRQTDTLKRLTSAASLMAATMNTANVAWDENTALMKEAGQRYATTESQLIMLKNKVYEVGISIGNGLSGAVQTALAALNSMLDVVVAAAHAFENADPAVQSIIIGIAGVAASIAPLLIIGGKLTSLTGTIIAALGKAAAAHVAKASATATDTAATTANTMAQNAAILKQTIKDAADAKAIAKAGAKAAATTADTAATTANTAANTANATTSLTATIKTAALTVATKAKTIATTAATAAQIAWNAAMTANPIGAVLVAVGALIAILGSLAVVVKSSTEEQEKLTVASQEQKDKVDELQKTYDDIVAAQGEHSDAAIKAKYALEQETAAFEESKETMESFIARCEEAVAAHGDLSTGIQDASREAESQAGKVLYLAEQITELSAKENKSAEDKTQLAAMTDMLNESCEGLNLSYDAQNDALNMNAEALRLAAEAEADRLRSQAAMQAYSDLITEQIQLEIQLAEAQENLAAETQANIDKWGMLGDTQVYTSKAQLELEQSVRDLESALGDNASAQQRALDIGTKYSEGQSVLARAIEEVRNGTLSAEEAAEKYSSAVEGGITADQIRAEMANEATSAIEEVTAATDEAAAAAENYAQSSTGFQSALSTAIANVSSQVKDQVSGVKASLESTAQTARVAGTDTGEAYTASLGNALATCIGEVQAHVGQFANELSAGTQQAGISAGGSFAAGLTGTAGSVASAAASLRGGTEMQLSKTNGRPSGLAAGNSFAAGIASAFGAVSANAQTIAGYCRTWAGMAGEARIWGWDAGYGFASGLSSSQSAVRNAAAAVASAARSILHFSVPDEGPLADADEYGPDFAMLIADGLRSKIDEVRQAASAVAQAAKDEMGNAFSQQLVLNSNLKLNAEKRNPPSFSSGRSVFANAVNFVPESLLSLASTPSIPLTSGLGFGQSGRAIQASTTTNNFYGSITLSANDVKDIQTFDDFATRLQREMRTL